MTQNPKFGLPILFSLRPPIGEDAPRTGSTCCDREQVCGGCSSNIAGETHTSHPSEQKIIESQQRVQKGQALSDRDKTRFGTTLKNKPLTNSDIAFLANQFAIAAAYSAEAPKPGISAAMFHLRMIRARLRNLISVFSALNNCRNRIRTQTSVERDCCCAA